MSSDPAHTALGFVPASEKNSLGPTSTTSPMLSGAWFYPGYKDALTRALFLEACYKGGPGFKEGFDRSGAKIFIQHERESDKRYTRRKALTTYRNYVGPIVDQYSGYVGTVKPTRSTREKFLEWAKNADKQGNSLHECMVHALAKGILQGCWWTGVDLPILSRPEGAPPASKAEDTRFPYLVHAHPANVVDFELDAETGYVKRLVIHHQVMTKASFGSPAVVTHEFHEWTDSELIVWKPKDSGQNTSAGGPGEKQTANDGSASFTPQPTYTLAVASRRDHGFGIVPFAYVEFFEGKGIAEDIAEANKTILNLVGLLYEELYNNTFSQTWVSGADKEEQDEQVVGSSIVMFLSSPEAKVHTTGANPEQAASIMNALFAEVKEIHRMAHMEQAGEPLQKRVAEAASKLEKSHESMDQALEHMVDQLQAFENRLLAIAARMKTAAVEDKDASTVWPRVFDTKSLREKLALATELDTSPFVPRQVKRAIAKQVVAEVLEDGAEAAKANAEIDESQNGRTAAEVQVSALLAAQGAIGPVELYIQYVDPSATPEKAREALTKMAADREQFAPPPTTGAAAPDATKKPANRPEKQPTPTEQAQSLGRQQVANQA